MENYGDLIKLVLQKAREELGYPITEEDNSEILDPAYRAAEAVVGQLDLATARRLLVESAVHTVLSMVVDLEDDDVGDGGEVPG